MKTPILFVTFAIVTVLGLPLHGENPKAAPAAPAGKQRPASADRVKVLTKALALKPDQEEEVRELIEKNEAPRKKIRADQSIPEEERKGRLKQIAKAEKEQIKAILSPEQKAKWDEMQAKNADAKAEAAGKGGDAKKGAAEKPAEQ